MPDSYRSPTVRVLAGRDRRPVLRALAGRGDRARADHREGARRRVEEAGPGRRGGRAGRAERAARRRRVPRPQAARLEGGRRDAQGRAGGRRRRRQVTPVKFDR